MDWLVCDYDADQKIWSSPEVASIYNYECSLGKILYMLMQSHPSTICQIDADTNKATTNRDAITWATRIALYFKGEPLNHNDVIGISAFNSTYVLPAVLGCLFNCTPFHAVNPSYDEQTLSHCYGLTTPKVIFCDGDIYEKIRKSTKSFNPKIFTLNNHINGVPNIEDLLKPLDREESYQPEQHVLGSKQTVAILCSSGTTGKPKAVCLCSSSLLFDNILLGTGSVLFIFSGIDWISGLFYLINSCSSGSTRIITNKTFSCEHLVDIVRKYKVTTTFLSPRHLAAMLESPLATKDALKSITFMQCGGGGISENNLRRFKGLLHKDAILTFGYALTEFSAVAFNVNLDKAKSVGKLMPNVKLRIVDDNGSALGPHKVGEILLYKRFHWNGYFGNPQATQDMMDSHGWYHSGDLGYMDSEHYLYIIDRKKEILKYQGFHYWPKEIEDVIVELPDVIETCVVGIYKDSEGDAAGALVVKSKDSHLSGQEVMEHVAKRLSAFYKHLRAGVYFVDMIPHNANGKQTRSAARTLFETCKKRNAVC